MKKIDAISVPVLNDRSCPQVWMRMISVLVLAMLLSAAPVLASTGGPVNHAPVGTSNMVTTLEDTPYTFAPADFGFTDPNDTPANALAAVKITTGPGAGTLHSGGNTVTNGQRIACSSVGATWTARESIRFWYSVASSSDGMKLVAVGGEGQGDMIYTSTNAGTTWMAAFSTPQRIQGRIGRRARPIVSGMLWRRHRTGRNLSRRRMAV
jgi:hypothetical protein